MTEQDTMPRYILRPDYSFPDKVMIVDTTTGILARQGRRVMHNLTPDAALRWMERQDAPQVKNHVCRVCRHRRSSVGMVDKVCAECLEKE